MRAPSAVRRLIGLAGHSRVKRGAHVSSRLELTYTTVGLRSTAASNVSIGG